MQQMEENGALALEKPALRDVVTISAAASALGVNKSTVSRQVKNGTIPNRGTDKRPMVSLKEARAARAGNLDPAQQRSTAPAQASDTSPAATGYQAHRSTHEAAKARMAQIELEEKLGNILARNDVEASLEAFGRKLRDAMIERWRLLAPKFIGLAPAQIEQIGTQADEDLLAKLSEELAKEIGDAAGD